MTWDHLHDEDVLYEFHGHRPDQLTPGRFYRGEVDGFADFGVFVTIGDNVTGLLHRSNIDRRLEHLDWDEGDEVIVQVEGVRDNGNVDLSWSIRQSPREFRGKGVDDPTGETETATDAEPEEPEETAETPPAEEETSEPSRTPSLQEVSVEDLDDLVGEQVRLTGRIEEIRQTSGPTIFTLGDETGDVECAAFEAAGVRAFPDIEEEDAVSLVGHVERHRGAVQVETETIEALEEPTRSEVIDRLEAAAAKRAEPDETALLVEDERIDAVRDDIEEVATTLRRAVQTERSIVIRHPTTVDSVVGGAALEKALRSLTAQVHPDAAARQWFVTRRPMDEPWYDLGDAMYDVTDAGEEQPLIVVVGAGTARKDRSALSFLDVYDVDRVIVDAYERGESEEGATAVNAPGAAVTTVAANVAGMVDDTIRSDLVHLPAISYGYDIPETYRALAAENGYDAATTQDRHDAIALVAYYQRYDDKRELIADMLFDGEAAVELAGHVSGQFRDRLETAVTTAQENADVIQLTGGQSTMLLDADALTHRYAFPPRVVLARSLLREAEVDTVVVLDTDACYLASEAPIDLERIAEHIETHVPNAAVEALRDRITFLAGKRDAVREAVLDALVVNDQPVR